MEDQALHPLVECERLSDAEVIRGVKFLADRTRHNEIRLLAHISEFDVRRLCLETGYRSAYDFCTSALGFDENEAYRRIRAARVIRAYPEACAALQARKLTLTALVLLSPWLTRENAASWLKSAEGKTKRELDALISARYPQSPQPDHVRNLPLQTMIVNSVPPQALETDLPENQAAPRLPSELERAAPPALIIEAATQIDGGPPQMLPITTDRVRVGFDAAASLAGMIERMRQLLRHKYPEGRLEDLIREAVSDYLDRKDPDRKLELKAGKSASAALTGGSLDAVDGRLPTRYMRAWATGRYIPAKVKSVVWARDKGCCAWRSKDGNACGSKDWIEYDHVTPYARGGRSDDPRNLRLVCRQHNQAAALAAGFSVGRPASG